MPKYIITILVSVAIAGSIISCSRHLERVNTHKVINIAPVPPIPTPRPEKCK